MNAIATPPDLAIRFRELAEEWWGAVRFSSSPTVVYEHPAYRAIIDLGPAVVPLLLSDLSEARRPWFVALEELTGEDPVPLDNHSRPGISATCWLDWGHERGLV